MQDSLEKQGFSGVPKTVGFYARTRKIFGKIKGFSVLRNTKLCDPGMMT